jgi:hypothetical protein
MRVACFVAIAAMASVSSRDARADAAAADALFQDGRRLMDEKRFPEACTKFDSAYKEEPTLGTLLNLANCRELEGKLATAWARWNEAEAKARQAGDDRESLARDRKEALASRLPKITLVVQNPKAGIQVFRDDAAVSPGSYGTALPTDPGTHVIQVIRDDDDGVIHKQEIQLIEAQQVRVELDVAAIEAAAPKAPPKRAPVKVVTITPDDYDPGAGQRTAGWVVAGFGGAALVGGFVLGGVALAQKGDANCAEGTFNAAGEEVSRACFAASRDSIDSAETLANAGQWLGIAGLVVAGVGVTLLLTVPDGGASELEKRSSAPSQYELGRRPPPRTVAVGTYGAPGSGGVRLGGSF